MMNAPGGKGDWQVMNWQPEDLKAHIAFMMQFNKELRNAGELVAAEGLAMPGQAKLVRARADGTPEVTDGPFAEAKEFLAGYWIVDVEAPERAYEIWPPARPRHRVPAADRSTCRSRCVRS